MVDKTDPPGKGWFEIVGLQSGDRTLAEQMKGLEPLLAAVKGKTILDLGCAEGLIGFRFLDAGAASLIGLESAASRVATARRLAAEKRLPAIFQVANLEEDVEFYAEHLVYRGVAVVLALSIAHKMSRPDAFLRVAAYMATEMVALRLPRPVIRDPRSGNRPVNVGAVLKACGLARWYEAPGPRGEWVGVFRR